MTYLFPELAPNIGKNVHVTDPDGSTTEWEVLDEIRKNESEDKILVLQRLRRKDLQNEEMFRFGYYIVGKKPKMSGKWTWGQYAPFISADDFSAMIKEAENRNWIR